MSLKRQAAQMSNRMWGGRFASGPAAIMEEINASIDFDKRLAPQDIRGSLAHAAMLGRDRHPAARGCDRDRARAQGHRGRDRERRLHVLARARGHPHERRAAARRPHRPAAGRLHTARSRNDQVATDMRLWVRDAIDAPRRAARRSAGGARREGARLRRLRDAGLHASAVGAARHLRPPSPRLCRDARPRPRPLRRRAPAAQRVPARRGGARRHLVPDRPLHDRGGARLRPADRELARFRLRPRFRARDARRGLDLRRAPLALRRGDRAVDDAAVRLRAALRHASPPAPRSCRRSATPTRPSSCAARPGASSARCRRCSS